MDRTIDSAACEGADATRLGAGRACGGRPSQQDDLVCLHDPASHTRLLVLADGMGGDGAGELASAGVVAVARTLWQGGSWQVLPGALFLEQLCQDAHLALRRCGQGMTDAAPHATVVALLLKGTSAYWAHVGDSRLYRFERGRLLGCTEDHSVVQARVRRGELSARDAARAADQHELLRGLGGDLQPQVDHGWATLRAGQSFALCSDGVWEQLSEHELAQYAAQPDLAQAATQALSVALNRGGENGDNVALILVRPARLQIGWLGRLSRLWRTRATAPRPLPPA
ncbi:PP2C family protein-serine/threonine phosphatase [Dyella sp.]|jgi:serine/threonine protein phosphatase PrpC|uniref:PP2C family protein-serine/threonine phosphatase n=1 Tax=Dyella sp. TaxID=1869338 RepID=UPI002D78A00C|nr:protein phosphatase 2C domain-containing protein [Dyella sp.]HET6431189.1 protein phosphatase 2C domain-containing protein [Dyella sp.]